MSSDATAPRSIPIVSLEPGAPAPLEPGVRQVAGDKIARSPVQFADAPVLRKPSWIRVRIPSGNSVAKLKEKLRENQRLTQCEEPSCRIIRK
jgi:lipoic acid synthetase